MRAAGIRRRMRGSVRARMTLLYGGLFTVITLGVLGAVLWIQQRIVDDSVQDAPSIVDMAPCYRQGMEPPCPEPPGAPFVREAPVPPDGQVPPDGARKRVIGEEEFQDSLAGSQRLVILAAILVIIVLAFAVSWWLTGRLLRRLRRVTVAARRLSLSNLHERIALT
ncbi:MAG: hypothetical protein ACRDNL_01505, partial [Spirillospora sp.]